MRWWLEVDGRLGAVEFDRFDVAAQAAMFLEKVGHAVVIVGEYR